MGAGCCSDATSAYVPSGVWGDVPRCDEPHVTFGMNSVGGKSSSQNQDTPLAILNFGGIPSVHLFAVFDGHGEHGGQISQFLRNTIPGCIQKEPTWPRKPSIALKNAVVACNENLKHTSTVARNSGSTGCICLIFGDEIFTANTGDSRATAGVCNAGKGARPSQLTEDHTVKNSKERARIIAAGGKIIGDRIYCKDSDEPGLIPSRSYGDFSGTPAGIMADPDIGQHDVGDRVKWIAIMSDGVWENVTPAKICSTVMSSKSLMEAAVDIVREAKRVVTTGNRYKDDMTAVVVQLHNYGQSVVVKPRSRKLSGSGGAEGEVEDLSEEEMIIQSVQVCQEAMAQGVHPEDVLDLLAGLTPEMRVKVQDIIDKNVVAGRGVKTEQRRGSEGKSLISPKSRRSSATEQAGTTVRRQSSQANSKASSNATSRRGSFTQIPAMGSRRSSEHEVKRGQAVHKTGRQS